jgi:hypothetical protein
MAIRSSPRSSSRSSGVRPRKEVESAVVPQERYARTLFYKTRDGSEGDHAGSFGSKASASELMMTPTTHIAWSRYEH